MTKPKGLLGQRCIYCADGISTKNGDHVPPQCFFKEKRGHELIKVPCCHSCNIEFSKIDGYIRNVITAEERGGRHPTVLEELDERRERSWEHDDKLFDKQVDMLSVEERVLEDGSKVPWPVMTLTGPEFPQFFRRITLALLYKESGIRSPSANVVWGTSETLHLEVKRELNSRIFKNSIRTIGRREFQYCGTIVAGSPISFWWMRFFEGPEIYTWIIEEP